jgi:hypothetical protein
MPVPSSRLLPLLLSFTLFAGCATPPPLPGPGDGEETREVAVGERLASTAPGKELDRLAPLAGEWVVRIEILDSSGKALRTIGEGSATIATDLGGRFYDWAAHLDAGGRSVRARGLLGFDAGNGVYQFLWLSELATGMHIASGRGDPARGGIVLEVAERDPGSGALLRYRTVLEFTDHDHFTLEQRAFDSTAGEWVPRQRTSYRRDTSSASTTSQEAAGER